MIHAVYLNGGKIKQFRPINCHKCVYKYSINAFRDGSWEENSPLALQPGSVGSIHYPALKSRDLGLLQRLTVNDVTLGKCLVLASVPSSVYSGIYLKGLFQLLSSVG